MINKYSLLQEYARSPDSTEIRIVNNYFYVLLPSFIQIKEYKALTTIEFLCISFNKIKKFL